MTATSDARNSSGSASPPVAPLETQIRRILWIGLIAVIAGWAVTYLTWPFSTDQGMLSWVGDTIRRGGTPYEDAWETRGPFPYFFYAVIAAATGHNEWGLRVLDLLFVALASFSIWRIVRSVAPPPAAKVAVIIYLLWYAGLNHHNAAQSDGWNAALLSGAVALLLSRPNPSSIAAAGAGVVFGLCMLSKPTYGVMLTIPLVQGIGIARRDGIGALAKYWGAGAAGLILALAACLGWFAQRGALDELIDVHIRWTLAHYTALSAGWFNRAHYMTQQLTGGPLTAAIPFALVGLGMLWRRLPHAAVLIGTWLCCALLTVMLQGEFLQYHWHPAFAALAALVGLGVHEAYLFWSERSAPALARLFPMAGLVLVIAAAMEPAMHLYRRASVVLGLNSPSDYERIEFGPYGKQTGVFSEVTRYVKEWSGEDDPILVWGSPAGIYYVANRPGVSRFGYPDALLAGDDGFSRRYQAEFLAAIRKTAPRLIVALDDAVCERASSLEARKLVGTAEGLMNCLSELPALRVFTDSAYVLAQRFGNITIWRLPQAQGQR
jgi:hypothetical protein